LALIALVALAVVVAVVLSLVLREGDVPTPTDGIGDIPSAHLVPEDVALYVGLGSAPDGPGWQAAFALLERLGVEDPLGRLREGVEADSEVDWEAEIEPFLGGAAVLFISSLDSGDGEPLPGAVIFEARDARAAEAVILERRTDPYREGAYEGVSYKVMEAGGVLAVMGGYFVYVSDEATLRTIVDARQGESRALADADDFRRLRNALEGDALAFVYVNPGALMPAVSEAAPEEAAPDLLSIIGLEDLFSRPLGAVVRAGAGGFALEAVMLGDPGPVVSLLRPRDSRFAEMVPEETAVFVSAYDLAGVVDDAFGSTGLASRLRDAALDGAEEAGGLAALEDLLALLEGEVALALWPSEEAQDFEFVILAEVDDDLEDRARDLIAELLAEALDTGDVTLAVEGGIAVVASSPAAVDAAGGGPSLAFSERFTTTVARLDAPLATFAYIDILRLVAADEDDLEGLDLDGNALGFIVNLVLEDDRLQVEAALTAGGE
jgi:hypothetical protein